MEGFADFFFVFVNGCAVDVDVVVLVQGEADGVADFVGGSSPWISFISTVIIEV
jgi:hypothetical protein